MPHMAGGVRPLILQLLKTWKREYGVVLVYLALALFAFSARVCLMLCGERWRTCFLWTTGA